MSHYKLTSESIVNVFGVKLFRIELTIDCKWGKKGDKGGFIEKEGNLSDAWVSGDARVSGNAQVYGDAWVYGDAQVSGNARVYGNAQVSGNAWDKSPLQVQGTKHFITACSKTELQIGCHRFSFSHWKKNFKTIGKENGYTPDEIKEYGMYIDLAIKLYSKQ